MGVLAQAPTENTAQFPEKGDVFVGPGTLETANQERSLTKG